MAHTIIFISSSFLSHDHSIQSRMILKLNFKLDFYEKINMENDVASVSGVLSDMGDFVNLSSMFAISTVLRRETPAETVS